ncbi:hypothetical protein Psuf_067560 [Phytohabitans suffuscus]|uniref:Uncharacterized protein n=1 Tax=Phytohabitans suffuscus TaxID=624315 RepID=A0A6F8YTY8_9ACTN|nr:hypothetical protein Psuf_067560 [Phytohabitans suffuscus]
MNQLEEDLTHTLLDAADHAPAPDGGFLDGVCRRRRARRRRRVAGVAGCAAVLTVVGGVAITNLSPGSTEQQLPFATSDWSGTVPDFAAADPPDEVWPEAVHRLPATLPSGSGYQVFAVLGGDRYLVRTGKPSASAPSVFNAKTGEVVFLGTEQMRNRPDSSSTDWTTAVGDYAVWFGTAGVDNGRRWHAEIWTARLDGTGGPKKIATVPDHGHTPPLIGVLGDSLYWDEAGLLGRKSTAIYRLPVTGGTPRRVPDSDGYRLFGLSPWADTANHFIAQDAPTSSTGVLWNVETGERRPWVAHNHARTVTCGPRICTGTTRGGKYFVQRLDGTGFRELPYPKDGFNATPAIAGRFSVGTFETSRGYVWYIWDLVDDKVASTAATTNGSPGAENGTFDGFEGSTFQWRADDGSVRVLDLGTIG